MSKKISQKQIDKIIELCGGEYTSAQIAEKAGVQTCSVRYFAKKHNLKFKPSDHQTPWEDEDIKLLTELVGRGCELDELVKKTGRQAGSIKNKCRVLKLRIAKDVGLDERLRPSQLWHGVKMANIENEWRSLPIEVLKKIIIFYSLETQLEMEFFIRLQQIGFGETNLFVRCPEQRTWRQTHIYNTDTEDNNE